MTRMSLARKGCCHDPTRSSARRQLVAQRPQRTHRRGKAVGRQQAQDRHPGIGSERGIPVRRIHPQLAARRVPSLQVFPQLLRDMRDTQPVVERPPTHAHSHRSNRPIRRREAGAARSRECREWAKTPQEIRAKITEIRNGFMPECSARTTPPLSASTARTGRSTTPRVAQGSV